MEQNEHLLETDINNLQSRIDDSSSQVTTFHETGFKCETKMVDKSEGKFDFRNDNVFPGEEREISNISINSGDVKNSLAIISETYSSSDDETCPENSTEPPNNESSMVEGGSCKEMDINNFANSSVNPISVLEKGASLDNNLNSINVADTASKITRIIEPDNHGRTCIEPESDGHTLVEPKSDGQTLIESENGHTLLEPDSDGCTLIESESDGSTLIESTSDGRTLVENGSDGRTLIEPENNGHTLTESKSDEHTFMETKSNEHTLAEPESNSHTAIEPKSDECTLREPETHGHTATCSDTSHQVYAMSSIDKDIEIISEVDGTSEMTRLADHREPESDGHTFIEPKRTGNTLIEPENDGCTLTESKNDGHTLMETESDECTLIKPEGDGHTFIEPQSDGCTLLESKSNGHTLLETGSDVNTLAEPESDGHILIEPLSNGYTLMETENDRQTLIEPKRECTLTTEPETHGHTPTCSDTGHQVYAMSSIDKELEIISEVDGTSQMARLPEHTIEVNSSSSDSSSDDESSSSESSESSSDDDLEIIRKEIEKEEEHVRAGPLKTKSELLVKDLPEVPLFDITIDENIQLVELGLVFSIVESLVVVKALPQTPALDSESVLFLESRSCLGLVFETFGPVQTPFYSLRFNTGTDISEKNLHVGDKVFYAPDMMEYSNFVFVTQLKKLKGSDASWEHDEEPPQEVIEYSDDEDEAKARFIKKKERMTNKASRTDDGKTDNTEQSGTNVHQASNRGGRKRTWQSRGRGQLVNQNQNQGTPSANPSLSQHPAYRGPAPTPGGALPPQGPAHVLQRPFSPQSPYMRHPTQEGPPFGMRHMGPPRGPPPGVPPPRGPSGMMPQPMGHFPGTHPGPMGNVPIPPFAPSRPLIGAQHVQGQWPVGPPPGFAPRYPMPGQPQMFQNPGGNIIGFQPRDQFGMPPPPPPPFPPPPSAFPPP